MIADLRRRIAVIGGGYAGMSAAMALTDAGCHVTVYESAPELGGRARRIEVRGEALDNGQHVLSGAYSALLQMMSRAGASPEALLRTPLRLVMPPDFELNTPRWPAPAHLAGALLFARGLGFADRLAAIRLMRRLRRARYRLPAEMTVLDLCRDTRQTERVIRNLWQPLAVSALNTPTAVASAQVFANVLRDALDATREASDLLLPRVDLSALFPEPAAAFVRARGGRVETGARVRAVSCGPDGYLLHFARTGVAAERFDAVVAATAPHQLGALGLPQGCTPAALPSEMIVTVYFKFANRVRLRWPMIGQAEGRAQWFFDRRALLDPDAKDGLIAAVISAAPAGFGEAGGVDAIRHELAAHLPGAAEPEWTKTVTEKFATFACTPTVQAQRPGNRTRLPGLVVAGDYTRSDYPATLEAAVRSGLAAAGELMRNAT
jgi:squalene-associated FAD-dependent desaturase